MNTATHNPPPRAAPAAGALVRRQRILEAIAAEDPAVILAIAPAGWGKTTLLSEWTRSWSGPVLRIDCDTALRDAEAFLTRVAEEISDAARLPDEAARALADPDGRPHGDRLRSLAARIPRGSAIAIDDAHLLDGGAHDLLAQLAGMARTAQHRLFIASRTMPGFVPARDVVHGVALRIDARTLAMDHEEITEFFRGTGAERDGAFVSDAELRTEGWPAGLRVLRHRLLREDRAVAISRAGSDAETLGAYFDAEILADLTDEGRLALADLALLDVIDRDACRALNALHALPLLAALAENGLFVSITSAGYRLHPMLRDHLQARMRRDAPHRMADRLGALSDWHARAARPGDALAAAVSAYVLADAAGLPGQHQFAFAAATRLEEAIPTLVETNRRDVALAAAEKIPVQSRRQRPYLQRLLTLIGFDGKEWDALADDAPGRGEARCLELILSARTALRDGRIADVATAALAARDAVPANDPFLRNLVVSVLQAAFRFGGDPAVGEAAVQEAARLANEVRRPAAAVQAGAMLGILQIMHGRLYAAEDALRRALALAEMRLDPDAPVRGLAHQFLGYTLCEWDRLDEAVIELEHARRIGELYGHHGILTGTLRVLAGVRLHLGERAAADAAMDALIRLVDRPDTDARNREWLDGVRAAYAVDTRDATFLSAWIARRGYAPAVIASLPHAELHARIQEYTTLAQALLVLGRFDDAARLGDALSTATHCAGRNWFYVVASSVVASAAESVGHVQNADVALAEAMRTAAPELMLRAIADTPGPIAAVLARARPNGIPGAFLDALRQCARANACSIGLTERERDVLALLADGVSNKAMARQLGVSVSTVKTHLHHIFEKLDARNRTHALARARALGLLAESLAPESTPIGSAPEHASPRSEPPRPRSRGPGPMRHSRT